MQEFRIKIGNAEKAQIEVVPTSDGGVEIVVHYGSESRQNYGSSENKPFKFHGKQEKSNAEIIKDFCGSKKNEEEVDMKQLKSFFDFYSSKAEEWKGRMDAEKLWQRWMETAK